ncbi:MarR family winged helix-turn-helix transcriptional regulator [Arthrobacter sp. JSM 101049]|uniref:MarR family winged helix-turn-helix transcriptional regulator n=1 Tax=Arthrobacter sp. JSM 101049 TaxID=929097 RepID=UPI0035658D2C
MTHLPDPFNAAAPPTQAPADGPADGQPAGAAGLDAAISDVERQFGLLVISARRSIRNRAASIHPDLPPLGYKVLTLLNHSAGRQQVELAEELQADKAMMSRTIKQMAAFGLVTCASDPADGRAKLVSITDAARERYEQSIAESRKLLHGRLSTWGQDEVERFAELLARLNETSATGNSPD